MAKELIAFLNFEFRQKLRNIKSVSGDTLAEVPRFVINWADYQAVLAARGLKHEVADRPLFRRYLSYLSSEDLYNDLVSFQKELRGALAEALRRRAVPEALWKRVFKDTNGLPMFIEAEGEGGWTPESADAISFHYDFSADTYRLFVLATLRGLILSRRLFLLTVDAKGIFHMPEDFYDPPQAAAPTEAELRAALQTAVARELPAALSAAVADKLPLALAESAAEKLPLIMEPLVEAQLPEALAGAVEERLGAALAEAVERDLPEALDRAVLQKFSDELSEVLAKAVEARLPEALEAAVRENMPENPPPALAPADEEIVPMADEAPLAPARAEEAAESASVSISGSSWAPSFSISVPGMRHIEASCSISVPSSAWSYTEVEEDFIFPQEFTEDDDLEPLPPAETGGSGADFVFPVEETEVIEEIEPEPQAPPKALETPDSPGADPAEEVFSFAVSGVNDETGIQGGELPDIDPMEYAETFQEEMVEEGLALFDAPGPARERDEDDGYLHRPAQPSAAGFEEYADPGVQHDIPAEREDAPGEAIENTEEEESAEELLPVDADEPLVLCERAEPEEQKISEAAAEEGEAFLDSLDADETIIPLVLAADEQEDGNGDKTEGEDDDGWLPFLKIPSQKKGRKLPLEQRLATLEQRKKRRPENDGQEKFDF